MQVTEILNEMQLEHEILSHMPEEERTDFLVREANERLHQVIDDLREDTFNHWRVYSLCKKVNIIAEIKEKEFASLPLVDKLITITRLITFVDSDIIMNGVKEYHESVR